MSDVEPFLGEIRMMSFAYAPRGWAQCNGQLLPINQNQALFSLLGTQFGGDGRTTFALPDLRGRVPIHTGGSHPTVGERAGEEAHTLTLAELSTHTHVLNASTADANSPVPTGNVLAKTGGNQLYGPPSNLVSLVPGTVTNIGGGQAHLNMQPYLAINYCIALLGIFPSPN
jgi:microcystin-dependent protein